MELQNLDGIFQQCGFNITESKLLSLLSQEELISPSRLAKLANIKRPTAYAALENLVSAGLVIKQKGAHGARFSLIPRNSIHHILEERARLDYERVKSASIELHRTLKNIPVAPSRRIGAFEIRSLESKSLIQNQLYEALTSGEFVAICNPQLIPANVLKSTVLAFLKKTAKEQPHIREIAVDGKHTEWYAGHISNKNHQLKYLPKNTGILSDIIMFDGNIVVTHYDKGSELGIRIREERLYRSLRAAFELLWSFL